MLKLLVLNDYHDYPVRQTIWDHLYSFARYAPASIFTYNTAAGRMPSWLAHFPFDAILFQTPFLSARWNPPLFAANLEKIAPLQNHPAVKVALPQDEFHQSDLLNDFILDFGVDLVYSLFKESEWPKIYSRVDRSRTHFGRVLAGYVEPSLQIFPHRPMESRPVDVGYRAWKAAPWLGRHGQKKVKIAQMVAPAAQQAGLAHDISVEDKDVILGAAWPRFLSQCKTVLGVEGGASILDRDGSLRRLTDAYVASHPNASFEEVEAACFPGRDGELEASVITPRHFEACLTGTCQILWEGDYNGILQPHRHYLPLKSDFSNLPEILEQIRNPQLLTQIATNAYVDLIEPGRYTYQAFVQGVLKDIDKLLAQRGHTPSHQPHSLRHTQRALGDGLGWAKLACKTRLRQIKRALIPSKALS